MTLHCAAAKAIHSPQRKRVVKACERCRIKKAKCDGELPCGLCRLGNALCEFQSARRPQADRAVPRGYADMLERHIALLKTALQEMYEQLQTCHAWPGPVLSKVGGHPLTHDVLAALDLREHAKEGDHHDDVCKSGVVALDISFGGGTAVSQHSPGSDPACVKVRANTKPRHQMFGPHVPTQGCGTRPLFQDSPVESPASTSTKDLPRPADSPSSRSYTLPLFCARPPESQTREWAENPGIFALQPGGHAQTWQAFNACAIEHTSGQPNWVSASLSYSLADEAMCPWLPPQNFNTFDQEGRYYGSNPKMR
ncbi:Fluconazole resistance protein 1 [Friedmanniomyces endolithicus]|nr:Fluconazole resistance protein 1 [Friedmanniomyces endolithicus]KAK1021216.1 Fluconazole resistance protein 1 [Friedmanniomyces endolithicus]